MISFSKEQNVLSIIQEIKSLKNEVYSDSNRKFSALPKIKQTEITWLNQAQWYLEKFIDSHFHSLYCHDCGKMWSISNDSAYDQEIVLECSNCGAKYFNAQDHFTDDNLKKLERL